MVIGNRMFDPVSGFVYDEQGQQLAGRWIAYPELLHPEVVQKYFNLLSSKIIKFWGEGKTKLVLTQNGYELAGDKGDGRTIQLNLGNMIVFLNQHGMEGLEKEIEKLLTTKGK